MKKSDLKKIVREELVNVLRSQINEAFGDPIAAKLEKNYRGIRSSRWTNFWRSAAKTYDIAWDKIPKGSFRSVQPTDPAVKKGMAFYVINSDVENPFSTSSYAYDSTIGGPSVLAVTVDNKIQYFNNSSSVGRAKGIGSKTQAGNYRGAPSPVGRGIRGTLMVKKLQQLADEVFVFDIESYRGGTTALKSARADLKLGKDKFTNHRDWKRANLDRYQQILSARIGTRDQVDRMVADAVKITNQAIEDGATLPKVGKYGDLMTTLNDKEVTVDSVTRLQSNILTDYARYIRSENEEETYKKQGREVGGYYTKQKQEYALRIKQSLNSLKQGNLRQ